MDPVRGTRREVAHTRRVCSAHLTFSMNDPFSGQMLFSTVVDKQFDSDQQASNNSATAMAGMLMGMDTSESDLPSAQQTLDDLVNQCVDAFVAKISPHSTRFAVALEKGKSDAVGTGNKMAYAGDSQEALDLYEEALRAKPEDDGAAFNAGVMCEKLQKLEQAEKYYTKAFQLKNKDKYVEARGGVRQNLHMAGQVPKPQAAPSHADQPANAVDQPAQPDKPAEPKVETPPAAD